MDERFNLSDIAATVHANLIESHSPKPDRKTHKIRQRYVRVLDGVKKLEDNNVLTNRRNVRRASDLGRFTTRKAVRQLVASGLLREYAECTDINARGIGTERNLVHVLHPEIGVVYRTYHVTEHGKLQQEIMRRDVEQFSSDTARWRDTQAI